MRRSTVIYILLLVILAGLYNSLNNRIPETDLEEPAFTQESIEYLFDSTDGIPTSIRIESKTGDIVELARNAENAWVLTKPTEASADQGTVEAAAGQLTTVRVLDRIQGLSKDAVGLADPEYTLTMQFSGDVERIIDIGVLTPTESGYYASQGQEDDVLIVSNAGLDVLIGFLTNPPYLATEAPPLSPTEVDPAPTATPQP
ncbi:MAG TPA: DUF4340 domain-containing protein [Anaerolineales bacterium]|nr:DUF4340 domain-containing protein [Anaerolineales bacterium]